MENWFAYTDDTANPDTDKPEYFIELEYPGTEEDPNHYLVPNLTVKTLADGTILGAAFYRNAKEGGVKLTVRVRNIAGDTLRSWG